MHEKERKSDHKEHKPKFEMTCMHETITPEKVQMKEQKKNCINISTEDNEAYETPKI